METDWVLGWSVEQMQLGTVPLLNIKEAIWKKVLIYTLTLTGATAFFAFQVTVSPAIILEVGQQHLSENSFSLLQRRVQHDTGYHGRESGDKTLQQPPSMSVWWGWVWWRRNRTQNQVLTADVTLDFLTSKRVSSTNWAQFWRWKSGPWLWELPINHMMPSNRFSRIWGYPAFTWTLKDQEHVLPKWVILRASFLRKKIQVVHFSQSTCPHLVTPHCSVNISTGCLYTAKLWKWQKQS